MKSLLRRLYSPIINYFEAGEGQYNYKPSHRTILMAVGGLFLVLSIISALAGVFTAQVGAVIPFLVFFLIGSVCIVLGLVGSDRAVAKIWGNK